MQEQLPSNRKVRCRWIHSDMEEGKALDQRLDVGGEG